MYYYKINEKFCFSIETLDYNEISKEVFEKTEDKIFFLKRMPLGSTKNSLLIQDVKELSIGKETIGKISLKNIEKSIEVNDFIEKKITEGKVVLINLSYGLNFNDENPRKKTVTILGLGDVGGTLLLGLRLLGKDIIEEIRLFDLNEDKIKR